MKQSVHPQCSCILVLHNDRWQYAKSVLLSMGVHKARKLSSKFVWNIALEIIQVNQVNQGYIGLLVLVGSKVYELDSSLFNTIL